MSFEKADDKCFGKINVSRGGCIQTYWMPPWFGRTSCADAKCILSQLTGNREVVPQTSSHTHFCYILFPLHLGARWGPWDTPRAIPEWFYGYIELGKHPDAFELTQWSSVDI